MVPRFPLVNLCEIHKEYSLPSCSVTALAGVSLAVDRGEFIAIMGPSGSGKTTLLNIIGALDRPTSGGYLFDGLPLPHDDGQAMARFRNRNIGFVFQTFSLLPRHTCVANVELPLLYARISRQERQARARAALDLVGLGHRLHHYPSQLSGGEQQRVAIARAVVNGASLVLADEPTGNLDSATAGQILHLFAELNQGGTTMAVVTHNPSVAALARRVVLMQDGRIVEDKRPAATFRSGQVTAG